MMKKSAYIGNKLCVMVLLCAAISISLPVMAASDDQVSTLRIGVSKIYDKPGFYPSGANRDWTIGIRGLVADQLVQVGTNGEAVPSLAQSWEVKDDGKTWIFHLQKNASWHDGKPVTSGDVKFTYEYSRKRSPSSDKFFSEYLDTIEAPDESTVIFRLKKPFSPFLTWYTLGGETIIPEHIWSKVNPANASESEDMTGSGPFLFERFDRDRNVLIFKANANYFGETPKVDRVEVQMFKGEDTMLMALKKGDIDVATHITGSSVPSLSSDADLKVVFTPSLSVKNLWFNLRQYPMNITNMRKAFAYAIDYQQLSEASISGHGEAGGYAPDISPSMYWYNPDAKRYERNLSMAESLLNSSGFIDRDGDGVRELPSGGDLKIDLYVPSDDVTYLREAELIKGWEDDAGIAVNIKAVDSSSWLDQVFTTKTFNTTTIITKQIDSPYKSAVTDIHFVDIPGYRNETFDGLVDALLRESDADKQKSISFDIQGMMAEDLPGISLYSADLIDAYRSDRFEGFTAVPGDGLMVRLSILNARAVR
jgi:peptide/nickel transport system substrate-binding protein